VHDWAVAQLLPGPNVVNLALMIGGRQFGWRGALAALAGMLLAPLVLLVLAAVFAHVAGHPAAQGALRGMGAVAAGLILGTALRLLAPLRANAMGWTCSAVLAALTFVAVAWIRLPLAPVLLSLGALGWWLAARRLRPCAGGPR
ncbi:MAG: chromate transporter, partial [Tepidimonas sp.]|nr:chromate transporter [Tepidimonas sp.]